MHIKAMNTDVSINALDWYVNGNYKHYKHKRYNRRYILKAIILSVATKEFFI